jgi:hypothetical protein
MLYMYNVDSNGTLSNFELSFLCYYTRCISGNALFLGDLQLPNLVCQTLTCQRKLLEFWKLLESEVAKLAG